MTAVVALESDPVLGQAAEAAWKDVGATNVALWTGKLEDGVPSEKIDVRAMGGADDNGVPDRVDVYLRA